MRKSKVQRHIWRKCKRFFKPALHRTQVVMDYDVLGADYGGWSVLRGGLSPKSVVYNFGIGTNIRFDLAVIERDLCRNRDMGREYGMVRA